MESLVIENKSNKYIVELNGINIEVVSRGRLKNDNQIPIVGDMVDVNVEEKIIENILPRKNYIKRPKMANLDLIVYVISAKNPKPDYLMLDKMLSYCLYNDIEIIIVFNKIDLDSKKIYEEFAALYKKLGYKVFEFSAKDNIGDFKKLKDVLKNKICIFSGNSGVGKSTIINKIFNSNIQLEGEISKKNKKGKNTTTSTKLYKLEDSYIADSPGFSTFDINEISYKDLAKTFIEFKDIKCEYDDCSHIYEQDCKIKNAVKENQISTQRYNNYCKIYEEQKKEQEKW